MSDRRSYDRLIGILTTVTGGLLLYVAHHWVKQLVVQYKKEKKEKKPNTPDDLHELRYNKKSLVIHNGSCHCERVRFRIKAPKVLNAVDIPSKIRFPRVTIPCEHFEPLTTSDDNIMSLYAVKAEADVNSGVGVYTFCSFCGVHVFYSPSIDPFEIHINLNCIDQINIDKVNIAYMGIPESVACPITYDLARNYSKRGIGCSFSPNFNELVPFRETNTPMSMVYAITRSGSNSYHNTNENELDKKKISPTSTSTLNNYFNVSTTPQDKGYDKENINNNRITPNNFNYPSFLTPSAKFKGTKKILGTKDPSKPSNNFLTISTPVQNQLRQHLQHHLPRVTEA